MADFEIVGNWEEDLIWCPSQIYLKFRYKSVNYLIYLRWRHSDPWEATVIQPEVDFNPIDGVWKELDIPPFKAEEYKALENFIIPFVKKLFYSGQFFIQNQQ